jgi:hypothetical protein
MNCQDINCQLLVQLIRLKKTLTRSESFSKPSPIYHQELLKNDDMDKQIDISYPSLTRAKQIDMEIIEMILSTQYGIKIEKKINECQNEYFRRATIQLEQINGRNIFLNIKT